MANRFQEWLRLLKGGDAGKGKLPELSPRSSTLIGRAQLARFLAQSTLRPTDPLPYSGGDAVACELSREAIYWALLALREAAPSAEHTLSTLWSEADRELLDRAAGGPGEAERLHADLLSKTFADFAELDVAAQAAAAKRLHAFADRLIEPLAVPQHAQERVWVARVQLVFVALIALVLLGFVGKSLKARYNLTQDMAPSASWKASSLYPECWCDSPAQSCEKCPNFFFHTEHEERPNIVFDLHSVRSLSAVVVDNRRDCCGDRGLPLLVQVSTDEKQWKTVATRKEEFVVWRADFPAEQARWVKLVVPNRNFLHLAAVKLLP
ncbi:MAG TPA: discoidin domain-containing protein [Polyangiaceae bacterium]|nr:discoidin domain-containing protein [Polyangiaceae bacterium]